MQPEVHHFTSRIIRSHVSGATVYSREFMEAHQACFSDCIQGKEPEVYEEYKSIFQRIYKNRMNTGALLWMFPSDTESERFGLLVCMRLTLPEDIRKVILGFLLSHIDTESICVSISKTGRYLERYWIASKKATFLGDLVRALYH